MSKTELHPKVQLKYSPKSLYINIVPEQIHRYNQDRDKLISTVPPICSPRSLFCSPIVFSLT